MAERFFLKRGDTSPAIVFTLAPPTNLTGATVVFTMATRAGVAVVDRATASIVGDPAAGVVSYAWQAADTVVAGIYDAEFEVTYADNTVETFPNLGHLLINIAADLG